MRRQLKSVKSQLHKSIQQLRQKQKRITRYLLRFTAIRLIISIIKGMGEHDATHMAAGVAYYGVLSIFPLMLGLISILGFILPSQTIQEELFSFFQTNLPQATDTLEQNIEGIINSRGTLAPLSLIGLFWSGSGMFGAISRSINRASNVEQLRPFLIRKLRDLTMALSISVLFLLSFGITTLITMLRNSSIPLSGTAINIAAILLALLISGVIFLLTYKYIPNVKTYWRYVWPGAVLAAVSFEIAKTLFLFYLSYFANFELIYGSVGSMIILLLWIYISALITIIGAEFNYQYSLIKEKRLHNPRPSAMVKSPGSEQ